MGRSLRWPGSPANAASALANEVLRQLLLRVAVEAGIPLGRGWGGERYLARGVTALDCSPRRFAEIRRWEQRAVEAARAANRAAGLPDG